MLLEVHSHTSKHSTCSVIDPVSLVKQVVAKGLQGLIITEHKYLWSAEEIAELRTQAEVNDTFLILAAQEISIAGFGHVLVFGADRTIDEELPLEEVRQRFPTAALIWAHPFRNESEPKKEKLLHSLLDGIEIFSLNQTIKENYFGLRAWHMHKFIALSGSDAHSVEMAGVYPTQFDHAVMTIRDVSEEIKQGRCRPFFKEIPKAGSNIIVTEITIGTKGVDEARSRIILKNISDAKKWKKEKTSFSLMRTVYESAFHSGTFRVPKVIDANEHERLIIEEGQRGKSLFDVILQVNSSVGLTYFKLTAEWLARLHNLKLQCGNAQNTLEIEEKRFEAYRKNFIRTHNPYQQDAHDIIEFVHDKEKYFVKSRSAEFIQNHGDYHPKNVIIGQDIMHDISTLFISVIDFGSSLPFLKTFDVGYFLAQFKNQLHDYPELLKTYKESLFIDTYLGASEGLVEREEFIKEVTFFKIRTYVSIASYLIKVGKGESPDMQAIIADMHGLMKSMAVEKYT